MAIFNSYVKLPEGKSKQTLNRSLIDVDWVIGSITADWVDLNLSESWFGCDKINHSGRSSQIFTAPKLFIRSHITCQDKDSSLISWIFLDVYMRHDHHISPSFFLAGQRDVRDMTFPAITNRSLTLDQKNNIHGFDPIAIPISHIMDNHPCSICQFRLPSRKLTIFPQSKFVNQ